MKNKLNLSLLVLTVFLLSVFPVLAAITVTLEDPDASERISGVTTVNATMVGTTNDTSYNCTFYANSAALTANTTAVNLGSSENLSAIDGTWFINITFDSSILEDATDYVLNATCYQRNGTNSDTDSDTNTGVIINNTVPTAPTSLVPTSDDDGIITFAGTVTGSETTACTLYFDGKNPGLSSYTMTHSGNNCSYTTTSAIAEETYKWYIRASDGSETTDSSISTTNVNVDVGNKGAIFGDQARSGAGQRLSTTPIFGEDGLNTTAIIIVVGIVVLFILFRRTR